MSSRENILNILLQRANTFLSSKNLKNIENAQILEVKSGSSGFLSNYFIAENHTDVSITESQLERLYNTTIYLIDGPFNLIDFVMHCKGSVHSESIRSWIETKLSFTADQIEQNCKNDIQNDNISSNKFVQKWIDRQSKSETIDSDLLALKIMETLVLLAIAKYHLLPLLPEDEEKEFKILKEKLMDWSEAIGLIRSLSDNQLSLAAESYMDIDIDFNPSAASSFSSLKQNSFEIYLLRKFKNCKRIKEIVEIVADRCGIPVESDFECEKKPNISVVKPQAKHWRRVKPATLPLKRITSSTVNRPSSLSVSEVKSNRFLSASSNSRREVDLTIKPVIEADTSGTCGSRRRHSEASAPQIIQHTTPTKTRKPFQSSSSSSNSSTAFVILETPPRVLLSSKQSLNDLTSSVRRLFPMEE